MKMNKPDIDGDLPPEMSVQHKKQVNGLNADEMNRAFLRLQISEYVNTYLAIMGMVCGIVEREISFTHGIDK